MKALVESFKVALFILYPAFVVFIMIVSIL